MISRESGSSIVGWLQEKKYMSPEIINTSHHGTVSVEDPAQQN